MKKFIVVSALAILFYFIGWSLSTLRLKNRSELFKESILKKTSSVSKKKPHLDLSGIYSDQWDTVIVWRPYTNICTLGVKGTFLNPVICFNLPNKGVSYLLFVRKNTLVAEVEISRQILDFDNNKVPSRIPKMSATFRIILGGDFPRAELDSDRL